MWCLLEGTSSNGNGWFVCVVLSMPMIMCVYIYVCIVTVFVRKTMGAHLFWNSTPLEFLVYFWSELFLFFIELVTILLLFYVLWFFCWWGVWDLNSPTRGQTWSAYIGRHNLSRGTDREAPPPLFLNHSLYTVLLHVTLLFGTQSV